MEEKTFKFNLKQAFNRIALLKLDSKKYLQNVIKSASFLKKQITNYNEYETFAVLGSGYNEIAESSDFKINKIIHYSKIPFWPISTAPHHKGNLIFAEFNNKKIIFMQGRHHLLEGYMMNEIAFPIYVLSFLNVKKMITCNAAASLNKEKIKIGEICLISDHINAMGTNPIIGLNVPEFGVRFPIPQNLYDENLRNQLLDFANKNNISLKSGIYVGYPGGIFETKAEASLYKPYAEMIGMSIIPEVIAAFRRNIKVVGLSTATIYSIGDNPNYVNDDFIMEQTKKMAEWIKLMIQHLI